MYDKNKELEIEYLKELNNQDIRSKERFKKYRDALLDSSLISTTKLSQTYDFKVIECGDITQVYFFNGRTYNHTNEGYEKQKINEDYKKKKLNDVLNAEYKVESIEEFNEDLLISKKFKDKELKGEIKETNIIRSKNNMCRLVDTNSSIMKTFITLTFSENMTNLTQANKKFNYFISKIKRVYPSLSYIGVPEFQKSGRVHYHLLTNIGYDSLLLNENISLDKYIKDNQENLDLEPFKECNIVLKPLQKMNDLPIVLREQDGKLENTKKIYNNDTKGFDLFKTIKYWNEGFSNVQPISICGGTKNLARYMAKYMIKDFDNRLFGRHRYLFSQNLKQPKIKYLNSQNEKDLLEIADLLSSPVRFENEYYTKLGNGITFLEVHSPDNESKQQKCQ